MKLFFNLFAVVFVMSAGSAAYASPITYDYSYQVFNTTTNVYDVISGSFTGTASGNTIAGLNNITCSFNGSPISGSGNLFSGSYNGSNWSNSATVSLTGGLTSNFIFSSVTPNNIPNNLLPNNLPTASYFYLIPWPTGAGETNAMQFYSPATGYVNLFNGNYNTASFSVQAAPTPIPAAVWLLGSGLLGLFGVRRKVGRSEKYCSIVNR